MTDRIFPGIASMSLHRNGTTTVTSTDGRAISSVLPPGTFAESSAIASCTYLPASSTVRCETIQGDYIDSEIPSLTDPSPLRGRPTIYLDQNHWSTLANAIYDPGRVHSAAELEAARELIELAKAKRVVLPVSAGHMQETCQDGIDERRYQRALTMLQISVGWRLTDPLALRRIELRTALCARYRGPDPANPPAVTLDPGALFRSRGASQPFSTTSDPGNLDQLQEILTTAMAHIDIFLDAESIPAHPV
ncbi:hypothetical protein [Glycomyces harbinensis]|uniref:Uncharacterized protein n=1 Tax=Glycomyces harbinensis TaxID=58114 RepID=A0A1G6SGF2_9ACTN|nr:hypothetical protein [Glycomyces harbinensis]SDD15731.1 hypothetical protein SAMN05216270_10276 [Glycomyces harbinensis]